jgi:hypothetical protein
MISLDGASLLFPTSFGYYNPHMIKMANKFPKLRFEHCGGLWADKDPKNAGSYFGRSRARPASQGLRPDGCTWIVSHTEPAGKHIANSGWVGCRSTTFSRMILASFATAC